MVEIIFKNLAAKYEILVILVILDISVLQKYQPVNDF
jgi:hypothetical protein